MRCDGARTATLALMLVGISAAAVAFEPGTRRICEPSADGSRFECRDATAADPAPPSKNERARREPAPATQDATPVGAQELAPVAAPVAAAPAIVAAPAPTPPPPSSRTSTRKIPNYLLQNPSPRVADAATSERATASPAAPPATRVEDTHPTALPSSLVAAPVVSAAPVAAASAPPVPAPINTPIPPATAPPRRETTRAIAPAPARIASAESIGVHAARGAPDFRRLPGERYTLEIARAGSANELGALIEALAGVDGALFLVHLRAPGAGSWSLLWSDFPTIDAARDARATLPADVAIPSGWPRRIGPLQAELLGK